MAEAPAPAGRECAAGGIAGPLLAWYARRRRALPFRDAPSPYRVWVSEVMLQQTQMATALPYYERFIAALPDVAALAECGEEELHKLWQGLGYYSRARNLQRAARLVVQRHGGRLPASYQALLALPGVGPYIAGAVASIAFGLAVPAVDGNVLRVTARLLCEDGDVTRSDTKKRLSAEVARQMPKEAPGDFNQALMELGALVCLPASPRCGECPLAGLCAARKAGRQAALPVKAPARPKRELPVCVLLVRREGDDALLLHRRPAHGLLAGLWQPLCIEGEALTKQQAAKKLAALLPGAKLGKALPAARHVFTHRVWQMYGWQAAAPANSAPPGGGWAFAQAREIRARYAVPGAFAAYVPL